jgi:hypothetical protein
MRRLGALQSLSWQAIVVFLALGAVCLVVIQVVRIWKPEWKADPLVMFVVIVLLAS